MKTRAIFGIIIILINTFIVLVCYQVKHFVHYKNLMCHVQDTNSNLDTLTLSINDFQNSKTESNEIFYHNQWFDIHSKITKENQIILIGKLDDYEFSIIDFLQSNFNSQSKNSKTSLVLSNYFSWVYCLPINITLITPILFYDLTYYYFINIQIGFLTINDIPPRV